MSSMLEQAIVDASALREAALKNAEQSVIEKYAPEIKAAVNSLLEGSDPEQILREQEEAGIATSEPALSPIEAPFAVGDATPDEEVEMAIEFEFNPEDFEMNLGMLKLQASEEEGLVGPEDQEDTEDLLGDLGLGGDEEAEAAPPEEGEEEELALQEIINMLSETDEEILEEELIVDTSEQKTGWASTDRGARNYEQALALAQQESTSFKEENEELEKRIKDLKESINTFRNKNKELYSVIKQLKIRLDESLLSNAKLIYSNRILSDASLNERQKDKIVEAIAKAKTTDEAKTLCETLKATVGSTRNTGPKSLSESVQRRSNLSNILPRRKKEINEDLSFAGRMKKLAGIS